MNKLISLDENRTIPFVKKTQKRNRAYVNNRILLSKIDTANCFYLFMYNMYKWHFET